MEHDDDKERWPGLRSDLFGSGTLSLLFYQAFPAYTFTFQHSDKPVVCAAVLCLCSVVADVGDYVCRISFGSHYVKEGVATLSCMPGYTGEQAFGCDGNARAFSLCCSAESMCP